MANAMHVWTASIAFSTPAAVMGARPYHPNKGLFMYCMFSLGMDTEITLGGHAVSDADVNLLLSIQ